MASANHPDGQVTTHLGAVVVKSATYGSGQLYTHFQVILSDKKRAIVWLQSDTQVLVESSAQGVALPPVRLQIATQVLAEYTSAYKPIVTHEDTQRFTPGSAKYGATQLN